MHFRIIIAALVLAAAVVAVAPKATSRTAVSPILYLKVAGYRASVDLSPAGTLLNDECTTYCGFRFPPGTTVVKLTARPGLGSFVGWFQAFSGWTPPCVGNARTCYINLVGSVAVKAAFNPVSLSWRSNGGGTVEFRDGRPSCSGGECGLYNYDTVAHVIAHAYGGYAFTGWWRSPCSNESCAVRMNANVILTASFKCTEDVCQISQPITNPITVKVKVVGHGRVVGSHIDCPSDRCSRDIERGSLVSLGALPSSGAQFRGWTIKGVRCSTSYTRPRCTFPAFKDSQGTSPQFIAYFR
jgi:Divergent InlB B-repeat domain